METRNRPTIHLTGPVLTPSAQVRSQVRRLDRIIDSLAICASEQIVMRAELIAIRDNLVKIVGAPE